MNEYYYEGILITSKMYKQSYLKFMLNNLNIEFKVVKGVGIIVPETEAPSLIESLIVAPQEGYTYHWDIIGIVTY